jgi:hypothetical protein
VKSEKGKREGEKLRQVEGLRPKTEGTGEIEY